MVTFVNIALNDRKVAYIALSYVFRQLITDGKILGELGDVPGMPECFTSQARITLHYEHLMRSIFFQPDSQGSCEEES